MKLKKIWKDNNIKTRVLIILSSIAILALVIVGLYICYNLFVVFQALGNAVSKIPEVVEEIFKFMDIEK